MTHRAQLTAAWNSAWNDGRFAELEKLLAHGYRRFGRTSTSDRAELVRSIESARTAFPDLHTTIEHIVEEQDLVAVHWRSTGTHLGPFHDLPVTGRAITTSGMTFARFEGDRVAEEWVSWDGGELFASLGVVNLWET